MKKVDAGDFGQRPAGILGPLFGEAGAFEYSLAEGGPDVTERAVGELIWQHQGRERAVSIAELMQRTGVGSERGVKGIVEALVMRHGMLIGGVRGRDGAAAGYFVICDEEDFRASVGPYQAQIETMQTRMDRLKRMAVERGVLRV